MAINQNWNLGRRASSCHHSARPFEDGETIVTAVIPLPDSEDFERRDYAVEAWDEVRKTLEPFSFWRTKFEVPAPVPKKEEIVEKESAEALLRRLIEEDEPKTENARYVLAVMLERKRTLKEVEKKDAENGSRLLIYEHTKTGDVLIVRDPMLHLDEVEPVQNEVAALLAPRPVASGGGGDEADPPGETGRAEGDGAAGECDIGAGEAGAEPETEGDQEGASDGAESAGAGPDAVGDRDAVGESSPSAA